MRSLDFDKVVQARVRDSIFSNRDWRTFDLDGTNPATKSNNLVESVLFYNDVEVSAGDFRNDKDWLGNLVFNEGVVSDNDWAWTILAQVGLEVIVCDDWLRCDYYIVFEDGCCDCVGAVNGKLLNVDKAIEWPLHIIKRVVKKRHVAMSLHMDKLRVAAIDSFPEYLIVHVHYLAWNSKVLIFERRTIWQEWCDRDLHKVCDVDTGS